MPMGSGKTMTALRIIEIRHARGQVDKVFCLVPFTIVDQWKAVIRRYLPYAAFTDNPYEPANGRLLFFVAHYEWMRGQGKNRKAMMALRKCEFDLMLADEGHKLANRDSAQSRRGWLIGKPVMYKLLLTGSPVEGDELDFFAQVRFINDQLFGPWTEFREEWTRPSGFMGKQRKLLSHKKTEFLDRIKAVSFMVEDKDVLDLPPCVDTPVPLRMVGKQATAYQQMLSSMETFIDGRRSSVDLPVSQLIRLQQITGGFVTTEEGDYQYFNSVKRDRFAEVLQQHHRPIIVFARFLPELEQAIEVAEKAKRGVIVHMGKYKMDPAQLKKVDVIVAQISTLAGLDGLQEHLDTALFWSKTFSRIEYAQARTRLPRPGQKGNKVQNLHFECVSSIDGDLSSALNTKGDVVRNVVRHMKERIAR